jgi:hypothetical protein
MQAGSQLFWRLCANVLRHQSSSAELLRWRPPWLLSFPPRSCRLGGLLEARRKQEQAYPQTVPVLLWCLRERANSVCSGQAKDCRGEYFCTAHCRARGWPPPIGWGSIFRLTRAWRAYLIFDPQKRTAQGSRAILTWREGIANVLGASSSGQAF